MKRLFRIILVVVVVFTILAVVFENIRARLAWRSFCRQAAARGELLELKDLVPPPVPDEQNFASTPLLQPLFDFVPKPETDVMTLRDWEAVNRVKMLFQWTQECSDSRIGWRNAEFTDLAVWQTRMRDACSKLPEKPKPKLWVPDDAPDPKLAVLRDIPVGAPEDDILKVAMTIAPELQELHAASLRPYSRFPVRYEDTYSALLPHLRQIKAICRAFQARALAKLAMNDTAGALSDIQTGLRVSGSLRGDQFLIAALVRYATFEIMMQPIWEGLARHQWDETQLRALNDELEKTDFIPEMAHAMRFERGISLAALDQIRAGKYKPADQEDGQRDDTWVFRVLPSCIYSRNKLMIARAHQDFLLPPLDSTNGMVDLSLANSNAVMMAGFLSKRSPYSMFARLMVPALDKIAAKTCSVQATANLAITACALERHRLATGQYPASLGELTPQFLPHVPVDPVNGNPLRYQRNDMMSFTLYSVGTDMFDDGGKVFLMEDGNKAVVDRTTGDWVWRYPDTSEN